MKLGDAVGDFTVAVFTGHDCDPSTAPGADALPEGTRVDCSTCGRRWYKAAFTPIEGNDHHDWLAGVMRGDWRPEHTS